MPARDRLNATHHVVVDALLLSSLGGLIIDLLAMIGIDISGDTTITSLKPEVSVRKCTSRCARSLHWPSKAFEKFHPRASTQKCQSLVGAKPLQRSSHGVWQTPEPHQSTPDNRKHQFYVQSKLASLMCFNTAWRIDGSFSTRSTSKLSCIKSSKTKAMAFLPN